MDTNRSKLHGIKSPKTNLPMGGRLIQSHQARETISTLLQSENYDDIGTPPDWWTVKIKRDEADLGDESAMFTLGMWYEDGQKGLYKNVKLAFNWYKQASKEDHIDALAKQGELLFKGIGTKKNEAEGAILLTMAAERGSYVAAFVLGTIYYKGTPSSSIRKDLDRAEYWLKKAVKKGSRRHVTNLSEDDEMEANEILKEINKERE